jgi:hypothetical protein
MKYASMTPEFRKIYKNISNIYTVIYVLMTLSVLFMKPSWCQVKEDAADLPLHSEVHGKPQCTFFKEDKTEVTYHRSNFALFDYFALSIFCWVAIA